MLISKTTVRPKLRSTATVNKGATTSHDKDCFLLLLSLYDLSIMNCLITAENTQN